MKMVDMKSPKSSKTALGAEVAGDSPEYPYGLSISLDEDSMKKLGMTEMMPVGHKCEMTVKCTVTSVSESEYQGEKASRNMTMQITHIAMDDGKDPAEKMYPSMKK